MSSISPELRTVPKIIGQLSSDGVLPEIISDILFQRRTPRNFLEDAGKIADHNTVAVEGLENIPQTGGVLIVFNHPYLDILLPALMNLAVGIKKEAGREDFTLVMASEFRLSGRQVERHFPGSPALFRGLGKLYPDTIILVPQKKSRRDYDSGRSAAAKRIIKALFDNRIVAISPEGQIEKDGSMLDIKDYESGVGRIAKFVIKKGIAIIPVGIRKNEVSKIILRIGEKMSLQSDDEELLSTIMSEVKTLTC